MDGTIQKPPKRLAILADARRLLAEARTLPEIKAVRDKGHAAIRWAKSQRDISSEAVNDAMELVLEAERRIGAMLADMGLNGGDRKSECHDDRVKLSDLGISALQSSRWQAEARVPEEQFQLWVEETREADKQLTSGALVKLGRQQSHRKQWAEDAEPIEGIYSTLQEIAVAGLRFQCIYADPPWGYDNQQTRASTDNHYGTMTVDQICAEPVESVAADNCHLHLWTTNGFLFDAKRVMEAWGFEYRSCFVWVKPQMGIGNYWRLSHEFMLLGIRGEATNFLVGDEMSWLAHDRTEHSAKPDAVRAKVMRVSPGPYLEMYGRERIPGWTIYGNQVSDQRRFA